MLSKLFPAICVVTSLLLSACASNPSKMTAAEVSPLTYQNLSCDQIINESSRVSKRITALHHELKKQATADKWQTAAGVIVFLPVLLMLEGGDGPEAVEYRQLKGEYNALEKVASVKNCNVDFQSIEALTAPAKK